MTPVFTVLYFLYTLFFGIVGYSLLIRAGLYFFKVSPFHPISQLIYTLTNPLVNLTKKIIDLEKNRPWIPYNILFTLIVVVVIKYIIGDLLFYGGLPVSFLVIIIFADLLLMPLHLLFFAILIRVIMSWVRPDWRHPVNDILFLFTEPLLRLGRFLLPNLSGFDFSPLLILVILQMLILFISTSLPVGLL